MLEHVRQQLVPNLDDRVEDWVGEFAGDEDDDPVENALRFHEEAFKERHDASTAPRIDWAIDSYHQMRQVPGDDTSDWTPNALGLPSGGEELLPPAGANAANVPHTSPPAVKASAPTTNDSSDNPPPAPTPEAGARPTSNAMRTGGSSGPAVRAGTDTDAAAESTLLHSPPLEIRRSSPRSCARASSGPESLVWLEGY